ncbi:MAG: tetratricopeptide repeat protein [Methanoregulaceae archaeon]|nr:tetratricopeptide repeat protein [Methanoregulaceae archaeon]
MINGLTMQAIQAGIPVEAGPWYAQANEHLNSGNFDLAIELYDKVIETSPACAMAYHNKGDCLDRLGKSGEAVACYNKAIEIDPYDAESWYNKGMTLQKLGNPGEALHCTGRAIDIAMGR